MITRLSGLNCVQYAGTGEEQNGSEPMADKKPLDPKSDNPARNDQLHAATEIQSPVEPEDYPEAEREGQVAITGKGRPVRRK